MTGDTRAAWALIGADDIVIDASEGWLSMYAPEGGPRYIGENHVEFFHLDEFPAYERQYLAAKSGRRTIAAGVISTAGQPEPWPAVWWLIPFRGGVLCWVDGLAEIVAAARLASEESPDVQFVVSAHLGERHG